MLVGGTNSIGSGSFSGSGSGDSSRAAERFLLERLRPR